MLVEEELLKRKLLLEKIKEERKILENERSYVTKLYEERIERLNNEIYAKQVMETNIEKTTVFNRNEIMPVIAYLVSLIENKSYFYDNKKVPVTHDFKGMGRVSFAFDHPDYYYYHIAYVCPSTSHAKREIDRFSNKIMHEPTDIETIDGLLLEPKEHYVQIAFYMSEQKIAFINNINDSNHLYIDNSSKDETILDFNYYQGTSHIRDRKYLYIIEFIDYLSAIISQKENYTLTEKEMKEYANLFVEDKKDEIVRIRKYL